MELLAEEMRRSVDFLNWKSIWWNSLVGKRAAANELDSGLRAYASRQAFQFTTLASKFASQWTPLLSIVKLDTKELRKRQTSVKSQVLGAA